MDVQSNSLASSTVIVQHVERKTPSYINRLELPGKSLSSKQLSIWSIIKHSIGKVVKVLSKVIIVLFLLTPLSPRIFHEKAHFLKFN